MPENVRDCEAGKDYLLKRLSFDVDNDIAPKKTVTMTTKFMPNSDGNMKSLMFKVLVLGRSIYSERHDAV